MVKIAPEEYALLLIKTAEGAGFIAFDLLCEARAKDPKIGYYYFKSVLSHIDRYILGDWKPEGLTQKAY